MWSERYILVSEGNAGQGRMQDEAGAEDTETDVAIEDE
jgi:hypothetical protein